MATYLLTWNPKRFLWEDFEDNLETLAQGDRLQGNWSCGVTRRIEKGDRFFMLRLGQEPKGIIGSGTITSDAYEDKHWDPELGHGTDAWYVEIVFDSLVDPHELILSQARLKAEYPAVYWSPQASGTEVRPDVARKLEKVWAELLRGR